MPPTIVEPKPGVDMGPVVVPITIENMEDVDRAAEGKLPADQIRRITVDALVDNGATFLCLPQPLVRQLGLTFDRKRPTRSVTGPLLMDVYRGGRLHVHGRDCSVEVMELSDGCQTLLGQIPLETLDFWVDVSNQRLVGNPEHDGEWMAELM